MGQGIHDGDLFSESQALYESQENYRVSSANVSVLENVIQSKQKSGFIAPLFRGCILMWPKSFFVPHLNFE